jgi:hypothetical protein
MFDGSRGHHSWSERELYMHCSFLRGFPLTAMSDDPADQPSYGRHVYK